MFREDEDFYIKINDGDVVTENKTSNLEFINEKVEPKVDDIPHYNSPEYAEYINKMNKESLKEIASEDINSIEIAENIKKEIKEKYPKKTLQLIMLALMVVLFIAILFVSNSMMKDISNSGAIPNNSTSQSGGTVEEFKFLTDVVIASASDSIDSYNTLEDLVSKKNKIGYSKYKEGINTVKENAQRNLNDVNSLPSYINVDSYSDIVSCLKNRYEKLLELCDKLLKSNNSNPVSTYNSYAVLESNLIDELNKAVIEKAKVLNVDYKIDGEKIIFDMN